MGWPSEALRPEEALLVPRQRIRGKSNLMAALIQLEQIESDPVEVLEVQPFEEEDPFGYGAMGLDDP